MELIATHINADFDALASVVAAAKLYPQAKILFPGSKEKNVRDFLDAYPEVLPTAIRVKSLKQESVTRLILVDISSPERLGEAKALLDNPGLEIIRYDHHGNWNRKIPAAAEIIENYGANITILVGELRKQNLPLNRLEATLIALGIYEETGNLTYTATRPQDLEAAAYALQNGADLALVSEFVHQPLNREQQDLFVELIKSRETLKIQGVDISLVTVQRSQFIEDLALVINRIKEIEHLPVLFALCHMGSPIYVIARSSLENVNVGRVAVELGGGGHATAASAVLHDQELPEVRATLLKILEQTLEPMPLVRDIMITPVITVPAALSIAEARVLMLRFGHSGLPVLDQDQWVGMITAQDIDRALHHGLASSGVRQYMSSRAISAQPEESVAHLQHRLLDGSENHVPVVLAGRLLGIVTRADILRSLGKKLAQADAQEFAAQFPGRPPDRGEMRRLMLERLPERIISLLHTAGEIADQLHMRAYGVGGFVRDILLAAENWDVDIVVEGDGLEFARHLARRLECRVKTHERFGTAKIRCRGDLGIDIATARTEFYAQPAALPQVTASSIKYDLFRRDFTINAMALRINPDDFGQLVDYFGGYRDLRAGLVRVLHPVSFVDDPTRIFRAVRFEQRYNFHIDEDTERYVRNTLMLDLMGRLSLPRIFDELMLILNEDQPLKALQRLETLGVLPWIHAGLKTTKPLVRVFDEIWEVFAFAVLFLPAPINRQVVYLMALFEHLSAGQTSALAHHFQFPRRVTELLTVQKNRGELARKKISVLRHSKPSRAASLLRGLPAEVLLFEMARLGRASAGARRIRDYLIHWQAVAPILKGNDLKKLGYAPGPQFEKMLSALRDARLDSQVGSRQDEIDFLRRKYPLRNGR